MVTGITIIDITDFCTFTIPARCFVLCNKISTVGVKTGPNTEHFKFYELIIKHVLMLCTKQCMLALVEYN